jgi:hypothetical protein
MHNLLCHPNACALQIVDHLKLHRSVLTAIDGIIPKPPSGQDPNGAASAVQQGGAAGAPEPAPQLHHGTAKRGRDSMEQLQVRRQTAAGMALTDVCVLAACYCLL